MTERHKQILLAVGIAALVWIAVCYLSGGCDAAHMELIALLTKALFDSPKARPLRRWGSLDLA